MLGLLINTVDIQNNIVLVSRGKILGQKTWRAHQNEANILLPALQKLLQKVKKKWTDVTHIVVVQGPGKFTSTRIGITVANTLAHELHIPIRGIDRLEMIMRQLYAADHHIFPVTVYIESERKDFFVARYRRLKKAPVRLTSVVENTKGKYVVVFLNGRREGNIPLRQRADFSYIINLFEESDQFTFSPVVPLYVRGANITQRKKR